MVVKCSSPTVERSSLLECVPKLTNSSLTPDRVEHTQASGGTHRHKKEKTAAFDEIR